jgi:hypothetical protein
VTEGNAVHIKGYQGSSPTPRIPSKIQGKKVTHILEGAFQEKELTGVTIPDSVTSIGESAFSSNQLTSITIPDSVTTIGDGAFAYNQLTSVTIPESVTSIGWWAFHDNQLTSVTIPANVELGEIAIPCKDEYDNNGKKAGTYTRPNYWRNSWTYQP